MSDVPVTRAYRIAGALRATFYYDARRTYPFEVQWEPDQPKKLRGAALRRYRDARLDFALLLHERTGKRLVIVETLGMDQRLVDDLKLALVPAGGRA